MTNNNSTYGKILNRFLQIPDDFIKLGISKDMVSSIVVRLIDKYVRISTSEIARLLHIPKKDIVEPVLQELNERRLVDRTAAPRSDRQTGSELVWWLSEEGKKLAAGLKESSLYCDVIPVPLERYYELFENYHFSTDANIAQLQEIFHELVLDEETLIQIGVALKRKGSVFIYGPPGNGKTTIAKTMIKAFCGNLMIPYAIEAGGDIISVFDQAYHTVVDGAEYLAPFSRKFGEGYRYDNRWVPISTPMISAATEMRVTDLDLTYNLNAKYYEAPLHLRANGGMFLIDDLGRQRDPADAFLNRWIQPLEDGYDFLTLATGKQVRVPFNVFIIYSTNLEPSRIGDKAFLRRFRSRIEIKGPNKAEFEEICRRVCSSQKIEYKQDMINRLIDGLFQSDEQLCACHPRDAMTAIVSRAKFLGHEPELTADTVDYAIAQINYLH